MSSNYNKLPCLSQLYAVLIVLYHTEEDLNIFHFSPIELFLSWRKNIDVENGHVCHLLKFKPKIGIELI